MFGIYSRVLTVLYNNYINQNNVDTHTDQYPLSVV